MAKKSKKPKTPKAPKGRGGNGGGKDSVTGLTINYSDINLKIESDKLYRPDSELVKKFRSAGYQTGTSVSDFTTEYEFTDKYIIQTIKRVGSTPDATGDYDSITRLVYQGKFDYDRGALKSASVELVAQAWDSSIGGTLWRFPQPIKITNPSSLASWASSLNGRWPAAWNTDSYSSENIWNEAYASTMRMENGKEIWEYGAGKAAFYALGNGRIFYDGWETNPFDSNLI